MMYLFIYSDSWVEHINHITKVLSALHTAGLTAKPAKCQTKIFRLFGP